MKSTRLWSGVGAVALAGVLGVGCGADDGGRFDAQVAEVRSAVADGDQTAAYQALDDLALAALAARDEGELSDEEISEVAALVESSRVLVGQVTQAPEPPPTTATTTTTTVSTTPAPQEEEKEEKDDTGKGKKDDDKDD